MDPALSVFWAVYSAVFRLCAALWVAMVVAFIVECRRPAQAARPKEAPLVDEEPLYRLMRPADFRALLLELEAHRRIRFTETERLALYSVAIAAGIEQAERAQAAAAEVRP